MSRFPKLTETFVLHEMRAVEEFVAEGGGRIELFPLLRERTDVVHPQAQSWTERAQFTPLISLAILAAHVRFLLTRPARYAATLRTLLWANFGSLRFFFGAVTYFPKAVYLAHLLKRQQVAHVHAHFASHPAAVAWVIHRLSGIPYSFTAHGSDLHRDRHMLREKVAAAAFVVAISEYNRRMILDECGEEFARRVVVIHCGVDAGLFPARSEPTPFERGQSPFAVLSIGTLHEVKGQTYLIDACRILRQRGVDVACHFVGDGPDREALDQQAADSGVSDRVHFHGQRTAEEVARFLQTADVLCVPSVRTACGRREGIPVVLMEAMSTGVPVVASRISGIPELVDDGHSGLLAPPRDAAALADAIERLHQDGPLRKRLVAAGRATVAEEFDLYTNAARLARLALGPTEVV